MPALIPEILFAIGKKLVEDGDSEGVIRFALSGKGPLKTMKNVYASAEYFKLYYNGYIIGWDVSKCVNQKEIINKTHSKFLMNCIGNSVIDLEVHDYCPKSEKTIIDKIIAKKQLISFSLPAKCSFCARSFIDEFLPQFSSTIKHVSIPSELMTSKFRDSFNLDSLTITDNAGDNLYMFCCKTTSLTFKNPPSLQRFHPYFCPNLSSIKRITFDRSTALYLCTTNKFEEIMKLFPSLELITFHVPLQGLLSFLIISNIDIIESIVKVPSKVVIDLCRITELTNCENYKEVCDEYDTMVSLRTKIPSKKR